MRRERARLDVDPADRDAVTRRAMSFWQLALLPVHTFLDRDHRVRHDRRDGGDGCPDRQKQRADHAERERDLDDRDAGAILDQDAARVPLFDQLLDPLDDAVNALLVDVERLEQRLFRRGHLISPSS
jgi:hypothetical protein